MKVAPHTLFAVPGPGPYLLSHSAGCLPHASRARLNADLLDPWAEGGADAWGIWLAAIDAFRAGVAGLIGADLAEICPQPSVSAALTAILSGLRREPGRDTLLASAHAFATVGFAMRQLAPLGFKLELIPEDRNPIDPQSWGDAIGPHVAAIVPMHVHSNSGLVSPMRDIAQLARAAGAITVGDICQAIGIIPVDPHAWGVDALVGSSLKWLCGGPGAGFLWMRRDLIGAFAPVNAGWFSHADPFEFDIRDFRYADDARRFWGGTPTVAPCVLAASGIDAIKAIGVPAIFETNRALIATMAQAADSAFDMSDRGGTLCLTGEDVDAAELALRALDARFDRRGQILRLSFHVWNDAEQARSIGAAVREHRLRLIG